MPRIPCSVLASLGLIHELFFFVSGGQPTLSILASLIPSNSLLWSLGLQALKSGNPVRKKALFILGDASFVVR